MTTPQFGGAPTGGWGQQAQAQAHQQQAPAVQQYHQQGYPQQGGYPQGAAQYPPQQAMYPAGAAPKSKGTAAVLAFFLGGWGAHNFYLGQNGLGFAKLGLVATGWLFIIIAIASAANDSVGGFGATLIIAALIFISLGIWRFVEFIMILMGAGNMARDARGIPLT